MYKQIESFNFWCQKVLPLVYDDSLSYYEVLCKLADYIADIIKNQEEIDDMVKGYDLSIKQLEEDTKYLKEELDKVKNGDYVSLYLDSIIKWIDENVQELVARIVKYVFFGLSKDGYFMGYIPESWKFMNFDTIVDPSSDLYGHLVMRW